MGITCEKKEECTHRCPVVPSQWEQTVGENETHDPSDKYSLGTAYYNQLTYLTLDMAGESSSSCLIITLLRPTTLMGEDKSENTVGKKLLDCKTNHSK